MNKRQKKPKGQLRIDNPETDTDNIGHARHTMKKNKAKHLVFCDQTYNLCKQYNQFYKDFFNN